MRARRYSAGVGPRILSDKEVDGLVVAAASDPVDALVTGLFACGLPRQASTVIREGERDKWTAKGGSK